MREESEIVYWMNSFELNAHLLQESIQIYEASIWLPEVESIEILKGLIHACLLRSNFFFLFLILSFIWKCKNEWFQGYEYIIV